MVVLLSCYYLTALAPAISRRKAIINEKTHHDIIDSL